MANHKTRDLPGRIMALEAWQYERPLTTREIAHKLKEPIRDTASALDRMHRMKLLAKRIQHDRAYWTLYEKDTINAVIRMPWLRPAGMRLVEALREGE